MKEKLANFSNTIHLKQETKTMKLGSERYGLRSSNQELSEEKKGYLTHCAKCHRANGCGTISQIPSLNSKWVSGNTGRLLM